MKKAAIIIVNWNGKKFLKNCLSSVYKQIYNNFDVYFVDNGSVDDSVKYVIKNFPKTKIVQLDKNYGFAKGNNEGIKEAFKDKKVEYIVCLNNDTIVGRNWLKELVKTAEKSEDIGAVSPQALFKGGKIQTIGMRFVKDLQGDKEGGLSVGYGEDPKNYSTEFEIFCPSGVSPLYRRLALEKVGLFDEDFFAYVEDLDLGWRIKNAGYRSVYNPKSKLIHLHSQTAGAASPFKSYLIKRNIYLAAIKNFGILDLILFPFRDLSWDIRNSLRKNKLSSIGKLKNKIGVFGIARIMIKASFMAIAYSPKMLLKRWKLIKQ